MAEYRVYVGFIPKNLSEDDFKQSFSQYGKVSEAYINREIKRAQRSSAEVTAYYGFVTFQDKGIVNRLIRQQFVPINA